jgi:hypothetical protein
MEPARLATCELKIIRAARESRLRYFTAVSIASTTHEAEGIAAIKRKRRINTHGLLRFLRFFVANSLNSILQTPLQASS